MAKKILKILLGLVLIPFCIGYTWELASEITTLRYKAGLPYYFLAGCLCYLTMHILFRKPIFTYVVAHELTHALFAILSGGSVKSFQASDRGGRVTVTKSNFMITLAPYFFPLYTFILILFWWIAVASGARPAVTITLVVLSGAAFAFHLMLTFIFLQTDQNDIREEGAVFSYPLIYLFNIAFTGLLMRIYLTEDMDYLRFLARGIIKSIGLLSRLVAQVYALF